MILNIVYWISTLMLAWAAGKAVSKIKLPAIYKIAGIPVYLAFAFGSILSICRNNQ